MSVRVQAQPFDAGEELNRFTRAAAGAGAVVSFTGIVRDLAGGAGDAPSDEAQGAPTGGLIAMEIEHYPEMTEAAIAAMVDEARSRWALTAVLVIHRHGRLEPGAAIMMVATAARHRAGAFAAADFLMDYLKSRAPFWKKEITAGGAGWVAARDADEAALARWTSGQ